MSAKYCIEVRSVEFGPVTINTHHIMAVHAGKAGETLVFLTTGDALEVAETRGEITTLLGGASRIGRDET